MVKNKKNFKFDKKYSSPMMVNYRFDFVEVVSDELAERIKENLKAKTVELLEDEEIETLMTVTLVVKGLKHNNSNHYKYNYYVDVVIESLDDEETLDGLEDDGFIVEEMIENIYVSDLMREEEKAEIMAMINDDCKSECYTGTPKAKSICFSAFDDKFNDKITPRKKYSVYLEDDAISEELIDFIIPYINNKSYRKAVKNNDDGVSLGILLEVEQDKEQDYYFYINVDVFDDEYNTVVETVQSLEVTDFLLDEEKERICNYIENRI